MGKSEKLTARDAFELLELEFNCPLKEIKDKYKELALKFHPDKTKDVATAKRMTAINNAYKVVMKFKKNAQADEANDENGNKLENANDSALQSQPEPNEENLELTLEEIYHGCIKEAQFTRKIVDENKNQTLEAKTTKVEIKPGTLTGKRITKHQEGDIYPGKLPANVIFIVCEKPHAHFKREKPSNLLYTAEITAEQAFNREGVSVDIPMLGGGPPRQLHIPSNETITASTVKVLADCGFPIPDGSGKRGCLYVRFKIDFKSIKLPQDPPICHDLYVTLENVLKGCRKRRRITRKITDSDGNEHIEDFTERVNIKPGVKAGEKIVFEQRGDQHPNSIAADVIFVIRDAPHSTFRRDGANLIYTAKITSLQAEIGCELEIPTLDPSKTLPLTINKRIRPESSSVFPDHGLPYSSNLAKRGELIVHFEIDDFINETETEHDILVTLDDILYGATKSVNIGNLNGENRYVDVPIKPGTKEGDRIKLSKFVNQIGGSIPRNLVFIARYETPTLFHRSGFDIELLVKLMLEDFTNESILFIPTLSKHKPFPFALNEIMGPNESKKLPGHGWPYVRDGQEKRGELVVRFELKDQPYSERMCYLTAEEMQNGCVKEVKINIDENVNQSEPPLRLKIEPSSSDELRYIYIREDGDNFVVVARKLIQDPPIETEFYLTLEKILKGCKKRMKISRIIIAEDGNESSEEKILSIEVKPGTESGTRFTFPGEGDQTPGHIPADFVFIARDMPHDKFTRKGSNIERTVRIPKLDYLCEKEVQIPTLEGDTLSYCLGELKNGNMETFKGKGLPLPNDPTKRGDLIVNFKLE